MGSIGSLYKLDCEDVPNGQTLVASTGSGDLWHQRLGHVHEQRLKKCIEKGPVQDINVRTKHIDIRYHFIREGIQNGAIDLKYVTTSEMVADILTKPLPKHRFEKLILNYF